MCDWNICPPVTAVLFLQSVLATTVHQSNMCILWAWHTNHRDVISFGLLTVQCLRADRAPISSPNRTSNWELQKMPFPGCFQRAEEQHPPRLSKEWNARLWSSTPGITSGSYTKITTWKEDASIYWDVVALQMLKIWIFLTVRFFTPERKASQQSREKN